MNGLVGAPAILQCSSPSLNISYERSRLLVLISGIAPGRGLNSLLSLQYYYCSHVGAASAKNDEEKIALESHMRA